MAGLSEAPVIALFSHTGFQDAADGASHQATTYFSALGNIPHVTLVNASCSNEAEALMYEALKRIKAEREAGKTSDSVVFYLGRENHQQQSLYNSWRWLFNGRYKL
jgi:transketolase